MPSTTVTRAWNGNLTGRNPPWWPRYRVVSGQKESNWKTMWQWAWHLRLLIALCIWVGFVYFSLYQDVLIAEDITFQNKQWLHIASAVYKSWGTCWGCKKSVCGGTQFSWGYRVYLEKRNKNAWLHFSFNVSNSKHLLVPQSGTYWALVICLHTLKKNPYNFYEVKFYYPHFANGGWRIRECK